MAEEKAPIPFLLQVFALVRFVIGAGAFFGSLFT
jgi:hypothetical protein